MKKLIFLFLILYCSITGFKIINDKLFSIPPKWPKPLYDFSKNPLSSDKILIGRALFYDPILSRNNTISCTSCHSQYTSFAHVDHSLSHGIDDKIGIRNAPVLLNLAWNKSFMWTEPSITLICNRFFRFIILEKWMKHWKM